MFKVDIPKIFQRSNSVCLSPVSTMIEQLKECPKEFYNKLHNNNDSKISKTAK